MELQKNIATTIREYLNENIETDIKDKIMFSVLSDGFTTNRKYGNQETNFQAFDVRSDYDIMNMVSKFKSFITTMERKDEKYKIVGLALNTNNPYVEKLRDEQNWINGRNGYVFVAIKDTPDLPSNINEILIDEAIKSAKSFFYEIKDWNDAIKMPI